MFEEGGVYYVKVTLNGKALKIGNAPMGIVDIDVFFDLVYKKLYFGNLHAVCIGEEDPSAHLRPKFRDFFDSIGEERLEEITTV